MNVLQPPDNLVQEEPEMLLAQILLASQYLMQIRIHKLKHNVHILELFPWRWHQNCVDFNDILVFEQPQ